MLFILLILFLSINTTNFDVADLYSWMFLISFINLREFFAFIVDFIFEFS